MSAGVMLERRTAGSRRQRRHAWCPIALTLTSAPLRLQPRRGGWQCHGVNVTAAPTYQFSVEEYLKLGEIGIFHKEDRVELLNGDIVIMAPVGIRHMTAVRRLLNLAARRYGETCLVDAQNVLVIDERSMPQPDLLLLRPDLDESRAPRPQDVLLLVEVADSSLLYDQCDKREAYARNGIVEYWLLDLTRNEMHVFCDSDGRDYRTKMCVRADDSIAPLAFPDAPVALTELLPA
jgi:Uma2 family endonuclease